MGVLNKLANIGAGLHDGFIFYAVTLDPCQSTSSPHHCHANNNTRAVNRTSKNITFSGEGLCLDKSIF